MLGQAIMVAHNAWPVLLDVQEALDNNQKLLDTTSGVRQLSHSRDAALADAVQRQSAAGKCEEDARRVSKMAMNKLQVGLAAFC